MGDRPPPNWLTLGAGALSVGGRPGKRSYPGLERSGCTAILSLLCEEEGALRLRDEALARGWDWRWMPLRGADPPALEHDERYRTELEDHLAAIQSGARVYLHCAAGLHRTGMIAAALLLLAEGPDIDLEARIHELRPVTANELRPARVAWARRVTRPLGP